MRRAAPRPSATSTRDGAVAWGRAAGGAAGGEKGGMRRTVLAVVVLLFTLVGTASTAAGCPRLRTFSPEERQQLETQYGVNWWKALGLTPGPQTAADWVERPAGDSPITVLIPQQFWDFRTCAKSDTLAPHGVEGELIIMSKPDDSLRTLPASGWGPASSSL